MTKLDYLENAATMLAASAVILGLYAMGAGGWSATGLVFLLNLNQPSRGGKNVQQDANQCGDKG